jgi:hypothetical protein
MKIRVLTPSVGIKVADDPNRPLLADFLSNYTDWNNLTDVTAQPEGHRSGSNPYVVEVDCGAGVLAAIESDSRFAVIQHEMDKDKLLSAVEATNLRTWMEGHGIPAENAGVLVVENRTREQVGNDLRYWLKDRPTIAAPEGVAFYTTFRGLDGTTLRDCIPEIRSAGAIWNSYRSFIYSNRYLPVIAGGVGESYGYINPGVAPAHIKVDFISGTRPAAGTWGEYFYIYFRGVNWTNSYFRCRVGRSSGNLTLYNMILYKEVGGETVLSQNNMMTGIQDNTKYTFEIKSSGASIKVYWQGELIIDVEDATNQNATSVGIGTVNGLTAPKKQLEVETFAVYSLPAAAQTGGAR